MLLVPDKRTVLVKSKNPMLIREVIPNSIIGDYPDGHNVAIKYGIEEVQVLKNLNIKVPSPIEHYYPWPGPLTPFEHQKETSSFLTVNNKAFVFNEMGTGKSASVLWAADYLMSQKVINKVLIVSPLSTLERVWSDEINKLLMHRMCTVLHGSKQRRLDKLAKPSDFYIINHDGLEVIWKDIIARKDIDLIVVDEASVYRNASTKRYKVLKEVIKPHHKLWMLTGTPCPNAPTDAWGLAKLVNPAKVPEFFGKWQRMTMFQVSEYKWMPKPESYDLAFQAMQPAIRFRKEDCLDLPPVMLTDREVGITTNQHVAYQQMKEEFVTEIQSKGGFEAISAVNAADKLNKIRQILCGVVKNTTTGEYIELDHSPRTSVLLDCIEESSAKCIVVVPFKGIINTLYEKVSKHYSCAVLNGDVSVNKRNQILTEFKNSKDPHVLLCHPKVMSHGLNLTEASTIVFYAPIYSNDEYQQVKDRINRPGQTKKMTIVRLGCHNLEWKIYERLDNKALTQEGILELFKQEMEA